MRTVPNLLICSLATLATIASPVYCLAQQPVKLARAYKAGSVVHYKDIAKMKAPIGEVTITSLLKVTVKEVKPNGEVILVLDDEGGTFEIPDNEPRSRPASPQVSITLDKSGKLISFMRAESAQAQQGPMRQTPEAVKLEELLTEPVLSENAVKAGDSWNTEFDNPVVKGKTFKLKTTFIGYETVGGVSLLKLMQSGEAVANEKGETMSNSMTVWINPETGLVEKRESTVGNPTPFGKMEMKSARNQVKTDTNEAKYREIARSTESPSGGIWLETLDVNTMTLGWEGHDPQVGKSIEGTPITLKGTVFPHGIGTHAVSEWNIDLKGAATRFVSMVGLDDEKNGSEGSVAFEVYVDGKRVASSGTMKGGQEAKLLSVDLTGAKKLVLKVTDAGDGESSDHADWAGAFLLLAPGATTKPVALKPTPIKIDPARMIALAPDPKPAIHGPKITGATPGRPFLFMIAATGDAPLSYSAKNLPEGLKLDAKTGIIAGKLTKEATTDVIVSVINGKGSASRKLTIVGGNHKLALTPPMGWNSWNSFAGNVDAEKVKTAADQMVKSGLAAHGFTYINIDDTWEAGRNDAGEIQTNKKFPDMKGLGDYIHSLGLKFGIYSSPGPTTCANFTASYMHEDQDAVSYANWGVDYLKYDWCSYGGVATGANELDKQQKPYVKMRQSLDKADRDILYSLCQYGMANVWEWGADPSVGGNCWRTTGDITDTWSSLKNIMQAQAGHEKYSGPGHWNDPDMLIVGHVGWGNTHPTRLSPNAQLLHISMWSMMSSPLLIGCDMAKLDDFTTQLLSNDEVLDINQDVLGRAASRISKTGDLEVWSRPLSDGTLAVCLVNASDEEATITANWAELGIAGKQKVRDLWLHKDLGSMEKSYSEKVPVRGCVLVKVGAPK